MTTYSESDLANQTLLTSGLLETNGTLSAEDYTAVTTSNRSVINMLNTLGIPALSVPCGFDTNGVPIGIQLVGRPFDEATLYLSTPDTRCVIKQVPPLKFDLRTAVEPFLSEEVRLDLNRDIVHPMNLEFA